VSVVILGANGSMGKRYQSIFRYLGVGFHAMDVGYTDAQVDAAVSASQGVVIATPTGTHSRIIQRLAPLRKPILCEKPVIQDTAELKQVLELLADARTPFRMMFQYSVLSEPGRIGRTSYNYFRHGSDGLVWDCMQIIGLARGPISLREESPVWSCVINGQTLNSRHMDAAYIAYVQTWLRSPAQASAQIQEIHDKTRDYAERHPHG
jgi:hypothetical protein